MAKKKAIPKTSPKVEEKVILKTEEKTIKKQSVQSKNQPNQSGV